MSALCLVSRGAMLSMSLVSAAANADPAMPPAPAPQQQQPAAPPKAIIVEGTRKICTNDVPTGSLFPRRVCRTVADIALQQAANKRFMDEWLRQQEVLLQRVNRISDDDSKH